MALHWSLFLLLGLLSSDPPVKWSFSVAEQPDGVVRVECLAELEEGWHIYDLTLPNELGPIPTSIVIKPSDAFELVAGPDAPEAKEEYDPNFAMMVRYHSGGPRFHVDLRPRQAGPFEVNGEVEYMVCNDKTCLPPVVVPFHLVSSIK